MPKTGQYPAVEALCVYNIARAARFAGGVSAGHIFVALHISMLMTMNANKTKAKERKQTQKREYSNYNGKILELPKRCQDQGLIKWVTITITT